MAPSAETLQRADRLFQAKQFAEAETLCRQVLATEPNHAGALHILGLVNFSVGNRAAAYDMVRRAIAADGSVATYYSNLCEICRQDGRLDEALAAAEQALALEPGSTQALNNLGIVHYERGDYARAADSYRQAIALAPRFAAAHSNLANALRAELRFDEAIAAYNDALALDRGFADGWSNLGLSLALLGRHDEALAAYRSAIAADPLHGNGHVGVALQTLLRGNFADGWFEYQWRWRSNEMSPPRLAVPAWRGDAIAGRHILLLAEQGLGDTIQFCRYAALLRDAGATVTIIVQTPLTRLLALNFPWATILGDQPQYPACDVYCPLLNLPLLMGTDTNNIPAAVPYLRAPPELAPPWPGLFGGGRLRVGIAWAGNPKHINDGNRSISLATLAPLFAVDGVDWVSLQVGPRAAEAADASARLFDPSARLGDFLDTAALMSRLDLVISIDSAVAHLAGAMGVPVWLMLPVGTDWRWQLDRADTPWYPTMRLFRQRSYGAWQTVTAEIAASLSALAGGERKQ